MTSIVSERRAEHECPDEPPGSLGSSAFAELYTEHSRAIYYLCLRLLGDPEKAEDATHDVFLKAFRKVGQFRGESSLRTWLYRIVTNLCYNRLPNLRRSLNDLGDDVMEDIPEPHFETPAQTYEANETRSHLQEAIENLDENYRLLITLRYQNELSYDEIASTLNRALVGAGSVVTKSIPSNEIWAGVPARKLRSK